MNLNPENPELQTLNPLSWTPLILGSSAATAATGKWSMFRCYVPFYPRASVAPSRSPTSQPQARHHFRLSGVHPQVRPSNPSPRARHVSYARVGILFSASYISVASAICTRSKLALLPSPRLNCAGTPVPASSRALLRAPRYAFAATWHGWWRCAWPRSDST